MGILLGTQSPIGNGALLATVARPVVRPGAKARPYPATGGGALLRIPAAAWPPPVSYHAARLWLLGG